MAPLAGLNYKRCRVEELKFFVEKRTGKAPPKSSKKARLLDTLEKLDEDPGTFRFLDLPAEMRNLIYGHLLGLQPGNKGKLCCSPTILRCSKQTRDEAQGILYGNNTPQVAIKVAHKPTHGTFTGPQLREYSYLGIHVTPEQIHDTPRRLSGTYSSWPTHLLRFHEVKVSVVFDAKNSANAPDAPKHLYIALNHCLYSICTFLASSCALKTAKLSLTFENAELPEETELRRTLWPITRLGQVAQLKIEGMPLEMEKYIRDHAIKAAVLPPIDVFGKASRLYKKVLHLKTLMDDVKQRGSKDRAIARSYEIQEALRTTQCIGEHEDEELRKQVRKLEEMFADPVVLQIKAKADAYLARVRATRDGAFEQA